MRHRAARPLLDRWRFSTLPTPVRSGMLVGGGLVVLGAALGVGLLGGAPDRGDNPAPLSARTGHGSAAETPAAQHTDPAPSLTPHPQPARTPAATGSPTVRPAAPTTTAARAGAPAGGTTAPANQPPPGAAGTRPGHGHGLAKGHDKH